MVLNTAHTHPYPHLLYSSLPTFPLATAHPYTIYHKQGRHRNFYLFQAPPRLPTDCKLPAVLFFLLPHHYFRSNRALKRTSKQDTKLKPETCALRDPPPRQLLRGQRSSGRQSRVHFQGLYALYMYQ